MAFAFNDNVVLRQDSSGLAEALRAQLALHRARSNESPPTSPSSNESTRSSSPTELPRDKVERKWLIYQSVPHNQFRKQTRRETERIYHQILEKRYGRKQTVPYDASIGILANAENNVRARWVEQGIWREAWGSAWPRGAFPETGKWILLHPKFRAPSPLSFWAHEKEPETPIPKSEFEPPANPFGQWNREQETAQERSVGADASATALNLNIEASRPYRQFLYQVAKEAEWIRDELQFKRTTGVRNIEYMAYESVKSMWMKDKIWNSEWDDLPGMTWIHEDYNATITSSA